MQEVGNGSAFLFFLRGLRSFVVFSGSSDVLPAIAAIFTITTAAAATYNPAGLKERESYGITTPLYLKQHYNKRHQMVDLRLGTVNDEWNWNRGALIIYYGTNAAYRFPAPFSFAISLGLSSRRFANAGGGLHFFGN